jgi:hypothetical protein
MLELMKMRIRTLPLRMLVACMERIPRCADLQACCSSCPIQHARQLLPLISKDHDRSCSSEIPRSSIELGQPYSDFRELRGEGTE